MASPEILSQTLLAITQSKLSQLDKQKAAYENAKRQLVEHVSAETADGKRTRALIDGAKKLPTMTPLSRSAKISLSNFDRFMQQAQNDPSVTAEFILECEASLRQELDIQSTKYDYAALYGKLVNEWISSEKKDENETSSVGREEARTQRATWEDYVFNPKQTDVAAIKAYLADVFESEKPAKEALDCARKRMSQLQKHWDQKCLDADAVEWTIKAMLRSDGLTDVKRSTLTEFLNNRVVLSEIADVLSMRMKTRDNWAWDSDLIIDQRRKLNGRYRFYPDEDLLQSIFVYHIGLRWAVELADTLSSVFLQTGVWKPTEEPMSEADCKNLKAQNFSGNVFIIAEAITNIKDQHFNDEIFLDQLPRSFDEQRDAYGAEQDAQQDDSRESQIDVTQKLLRMIQADIVVASGAAAPSGTPVSDQPNRLCKPVTVIRSDFKWFGPSIPHSTITTVLEYFGVNEQWLQFFLKVLEAPLRFKQDEDSVPSRTRKRGTPISTPLADFFGESLLFCVDFAVNQKADGARLYRLHDDMWLWGDMDICKKSWAVLTKCAEVLGLDFNLDKTGSATVLSSQGPPATGLEMEVDTALPQGDVTWGFLKLDSESGRFVINQAEVDQHIDELRLQLAACKSIFDWIQAWNIYGVRFFSNFFGKPANCFSRKHIDSMLDTFQRIQHALFPDTPGGAGEHLRQMISERFSLPAGEIPDGYIYFPIELGGLGLQNPFIKLCLVRDSVTEDPKALVGHHDEEEEKEYRVYRGIVERQIWQTHGQWRDSSTGHHAPPFSKEEYSRYRERLSASLGKKYKQLVCEATPVDVEQRGEIMAVMDQEKWLAMSSYDKWVVSLYGREMMAKFGGINVVEKGLLPTGMMDMLRQSKFQWVG